MNSLVTESITRKLGGEIQRAILTGSCSRGDATYRSDVDILVVLAQGPLNYSRVQDLRSRLDAEFDAHSDLLVLRPEIHFVLPTVFETEEPGMVEALRHGRTLAGISAEFEKLLSDFQIRHRRIA